MASRQSKKYKTKILRELQDPDKEHILREVASLPLPPKAEQTVSPYHILAHYFIRTLGAASLVIGAAGLMTEISFMICTSCVYLGLIVLCLDPWIEPGLRRLSPLWRMIPTVIFLIPLVAFTRYVVFLPSLLGIQARDYNGDYLVGTKVGDIEWRPEYSDLRVVFFNRTDNDYKNLDLKIIPGAMIIGSSQTTNVPGVSVFNTIAGPDKVTVPSIDKDGKTEYLPDNQTLFTSAGIRVICDRLPKHTSFEIVLAVVTFETSQDKVRQRLLQGAGVLAQLGERKPATQVTVDAEYESLGKRPHHVKQTYDVKQL